MSCSSAAASASPVAEMSPKSTPGPKGSALDLEQHIKKIISENAAIVETLDPLWSKKYVNSRHHSTSCLPSTRPIPSSYGQSSLHELNQYNKRRYSEVSFLHGSHGASRLQSALMGAPQAPDQNLPTRDSKLRKMSVIIDGKQMNQEQNHQQTASAAMGPVGIQRPPGSSPEAPSLVRDLLTSKVPLVSPGKPPVNPNREHPENPERSVIKDLLLKARDNSVTGDRKFSTGMSPPMSMGSPPSKSGVQEELSMLYYVCTLCRIAFRNKETLQAHQLHYCKKSQYPVSGPDATEAGLGPFGGSGGGSLAALNNHVKRKISVMEMSPSVLHKTLTEGRPEKQPFHQLQSKASSLAASSTASSVSGLTVLPPLLPDQNSINGSSTCITSLMQSPLQLRKMTPPDRPSDCVVIMTEDNLRKISNCEVTAHTCHQLLHLPSSSSP